MSLITRGPVIFLLWYAGTFCAEGKQSGSGASGGDMIDAYAAILDSIAAGGTSHLPRGEARLVLSPARPISSMPAVSSTTLKALTSRGYPVVAANAPLCRGELRVSFGPGETPSPRVYLIEAEYGYAWGDNVGDIEYFKYRVDCTLGTCSVTNRTIEGQEEIAVGC